MPYVNGSSTGRASTGFLQRNLESQDVFNPRVNGKKPYSLQAQATDMNQ